MKARIKRTLESRAAAPVAVVAVLIFGHQVLPKIDPEMQAPTQGVLGDMWRALRDSARPSVDVSDILSGHVPHDLSLDIVPRWVSDDLIGTGRGRLLNADRDCPLAGFARRAVQCDVTIGRDPCLHWVRMVFASDADHGFVTRTTATAKRCRTDG